ncbi:type I-E CRISPR-associated protein Cse1/CasA [Naumannella sp. ID2617S]|nr:type I-E CRISPR-associated protein Cse1/CasA [Naumannella sp. ID2617S]
MYDLIDEPWILAQSASGEEELSLRETFRRAPELVGLGGDVPTQGFAILRVLLAICHHAIGWHTPDDLAELHAEGVDLARVDACLDEWRDRFDLFHPERPFMQVPDLRTAKGEHSGLEKIIADVPNGQQFFTTRAGRGLETITAAEAARWLVHTQAFDPSGIRSGAVGDELTKGGKGYPTGPAWAGHLGGVVLHGKDLAETLRLNIVATPRSSADLPVWALPERQTERRSEQAIAAGPVQLLVWQSRRIRLVGDRAGVHGVVLAQGDKLTPQNMGRLEAMSGWRYSKPQSKKAGTTVYMPNKHEPGRALWRGLPALVAPGVEKVEDSGTHDRFRAPATLRELEATDDDDMVVIQTIGINYGAQEAVIDEIVDDRMSLQASLVSEEALPVREMLTDAVNNADRCVRALGQLAANLARAAGEKGDSAGEGARQRASEEGWAALDQPARRWVRTLTAESDVQEAQREWQGTVEAIVTGVSRRLVAAAGPASTRGRETSFGFMSVPVAQMRFTRSIREELSLLHPTTRTKEVSAS